MQLPIGVFGVALATVSMPALSQAAVRRDTPALKTTLSATLRLVFLLTVPAALWLAVMSRPVIALLYEHGRFHWDDTVRTADALVMYCIGLPAFAAVGVLTRTFYALGDTRIPVQASFVSVGLNLALNLLFIGPLRSLGLEHRGLALATSVTSIGNLLQLAFYLRRRIGAIEGGRVLMSLARVAAASALVCGACGMALQALGGRWRGHLALEAAVVAGAAAFALLAGWGAMKLVRVEELATVEHLAGALFARLRGRRR
jgi:putative peptidoglycan lipid II flippase